MESHENRDHSMRQRLHDVLNTESKAWLESIEEKAARLKAEQKSGITGGYEGEEPLQEYQAANEVHVRRLPPDPHGLIRISVGGGDNLPIRCNYLVFRGNPKQAIQLLRKALTALEEGF